MRTYNKLRYTKKSVKIGLVSSAVYAASTLAIPTFADTVEKPEPTIVQPVNLEQITTVEQAGNLYKEKLTEYVSDKKLNEEEIKNLTNILEQKREILKSEYNKLEGSLDLEVYDIHKKIKQTEIRISELQEKKTYSPESFEKIKEDFDRQILSYYPSLIERNENIVYSSSERLDRESNDTMRELVRKADYYLQKHYSDKTLDPLTRKWEFTLRDVVAFYKILHEGREPIKIAYEKIEEEKTKLEKKLEGLAKEYEKIEEQRMNLRSQLYALVRESAHVDSMIATNNNYLAIKAGIKEFKQEYGDLTRYMTFSITSLDKFHADAGCGLKKRNEVAENIQSHLLEEGFPDVKIEGLEDPVKTMFPWPWWITVLFGAAFPLFRNLLTASFVRRKIDVLDATGPLFEVMFGTVFLDGLHPLIFPLRVFGLPFIIEPIRALTGWRDV